MVVFESDNIEYVNLSEELVADYLVMVNDFDNVRRCKSPRNVSTYSQLPF